MCRYDTSNIAMTYPKLPLQISVDARLWQTGTTSNPVAGHGLHADAETKQSLSMAAPLKSHETPSCPLCSCQYTVYLMP